MSFAFEARTGVGHQVRSIAAEQIKKALKTAEARGDFDETVHSLRRRCKKIRGVLRLVQPNFGDYKSENSAVRDAADLLGGARDARVMVDTLDTLIGGRPEQVSSTDAGRARAYLVDRADRIAAEADGASPIERFMKIFADLQQRIGDWSFDANGFDLVGDGLELTYRQFQRDLETAEDKGTAEALHEWRKHSKYHWFHVTLLENSAADLLAARAKSLDTLGDHLGDHHNLAVLEETLLKAKDDVGDASAILTAIEKRQGELAGSAFALGHQLGAEKPGALRKRFEAYWALLPKGV